MNTIQALENVFVAEVEGRLPFQSNAAIYNRLCDKGLLQPMAIEVKGHGSLVVIFRGYALTHAGRIKYCESCSGQPDTTESGKS